MIKNLSGYVMAVVLSMGVYSTVQAAPVAIENGMARFTTSDGFLFETRSITGSIDLDAMSMQINPYSMYAINAIFTNISLYGEGSYVFDVDSQLNGVPDTTPPGQLNMTVNAGQIGGFGLLEWGTSTNIGVAMVWDVTSTGSGLVFTAADTDGDGVAGIPMIDGPFAGQIISTSFTAPVPVPAAAWLFASGLIALFGFANSKKKH